MVRTSVYGLTVYLAVSALATVIGIIMYKARDVIAITTNALGLGNGPAEEAGKVMSNAATVVNTAMIALAVAIALAIIVAVTMIIRERTPGYY